MPIVIVDCDNARLPRLAQCVAQLSGGVAPMAADIVPDVLEEGTLLICHVGDRQHEYEDRSLGRKLNEAIRNTHCVVAGFTAGNISPYFVRQMPAQCKQFVINDRASFGGISESFRDDLHRLVDAWTTSSGRFSGESFAKAWIGYDPGLEAILEILSHLLRGNVSLDGVDYVLEHLRSVGIVDLDEALLRASANPQDENRRMVDLTGLRDHLFRRHSYGVWGV